MSCEDTMYSINLRNSFDRKRGDALGNRAILRVTQAPRYQSKGFSSVVWKTTCIIRCLLYSITSHALWRYLTVMCYDTVLVCFCKLPQVFNSGSEDRLHVDPISYTSTRSYLALNSFLPCFDSASTNANVLSHTDSGAYPCHRLRCHGLCKFPHTRKLDWVSVQAQQSTVNQNHWHDRRP